MSYLLLVVLWYIFGIVSILGSAWIHLTIAEFKGYDACEYWINLFNNSSEEVTILEFLWGLTIWPVRLGTFLGISSDMYETYDKKSDKND